MRDDNRSITICTKPAPEIGEKIHINISVSYDKDRRCYWLYVQPMEISREPGAAYSSQTFILYDQRPGRKSGSAVLTRNVARFSRPVLEQHAGVVRNNLDAAWPLLLAGDITNAVLTLSTGYHDVRDIPNPAPLTPATGISL